jgi:Sulfotransferase domain
MAPVPDRVKKWAILLPTEVFPEELRVATRRRLLARLEVSKARKAALIIVGHPKSGNTWLRVLISRLYQVRHDVPGSIIAHSDELHRRNPAIPCITGTNAYYSYEGAVGDLLAAGAPPSELRRKPIVFLARNPCDIAVSWYIQFTKRQSRQKQELINHFIRHPIDKRTVEMWDFVRHSDLGVLSLIDYLNTWERNVRQLERAMIIRYEDLRADPATWLARIGELMGERFTEEEIAEAVRFGSVENMRELESKGFFRNGGMSLRNAKDPETFKVRRAKVGGYRDYVTPEQAAELEELMMAQLSPNFGYTPETLAAAAPAPAV